MRIFCVLYFFFSDVVGGVGVGRGVGCNFIFWMYRSSVWLGGKGRCLGFRVSVVNFVGFGCGGLRFSIELYRRSLEFRSFVSFVGRFVVFNEVSGGRLCRLYGRDLLILFV